MIKAVLVVASLGINTEMPNMKTCLEAREQLLEQDKKIQVLCVPSNPKPDRGSEMKEMFSLFLNMIQKAQELENGIGTNDEKNRRSEGSSEQL